MASFGERLKREREQRGVTLDDISVSTKISTRMLDALEHDQFDQLPGGIFNKGFIRAYARHLRLDDDEMVAEYLRAYEEAPAPIVIEPPAAQPRRQPENGRHGMSWPIFAVLLALAIVGFLGLRQYPRLKPDNARVLKPVAAPEVSESRSPQPGTPSAAVIPATSKTRGRFTVLIKAREDCWVSVTADDKPAVEETLIGPTEKTLQADDRLVIKAGNVGGLDFFFDGKAVPVQGDYGEVKTVAFDSGGLQPRRPPAPGAGSPQ